VPDPQLPRSWPSQPVSQRLAKECSLPNLGFEPNYQDWVILTRIGKL